jgi:hypothetical protein
MECKEQIDLWISTSENVCKTMQLAIYKNDTDFIIELLNQFKQATEQLEKLLNIAKKERFTA